MSKNSISNPKPNLFIFLIFLTQVLMNLPLLYYSWLKTQKGLVDDSVFYKLIFHWLQWSYNRVALVLTLQQKRSHSIWKHVGRVCVSFTFFGRVFWLVSFMGISFYCQPCSTHWCECSTWKIRHGSHNCQMRMLALPQASTLPKWPHVLMGGNTENSGGSCGKSNGR